MIDVLKGVKVRVINTGSCNGCDIEILSAVAMTGLEIVESGEDITLVTGGLTPKMSDHIDLDNDFVAVGTCACGGGIFRSKTLGLRNERVLVLGCPPHPNDIILGIAKALDLDVQVGMTSEKPILNENCLGCGSCSIVCPSKAIDVRESNGFRVVEIDHKNCLFCGLCEDVCPTDGIRFDLKGSKRLSLKLVRCEVCGRFFATVNQIEYLRRKGYDVSLCDSCRAKTFSMSWIETKRFK